MRILASILAIAIGTISPQAVRAIEVRDGLIWISCPDAPATYFINRTNCHMERIEV